MNGAVHWYRFLQYKWHDSCYNMAVQNKKAKGKGVCTKNVQALFLFIREKRVDMEYRIREHPVLGKTEETKKVKFTYNGKTMEGREGEPVAMALKAAGVQIHRYTQKKHEPRGIFCAIGRCTDCVMVVDGVPNIRTCITPLKEAMRVETQYGVSAHPQEEGRP